MPYKSPPEGYMSATEAMKLLGKMLYKHVQAGTLKRYGPPHRKYGYYKVAEIDALIAAEQAFFGHVPGSYRNNPASTFEVATIEDIPAIIEMSERAYPAEGLPRRDTWFTWQRCNPQSFHVVRNQHNVIVAYSTVLVMSQSAINAFIRYDLPVDDIGEAQLEQYRPCAPLHLYVMSLVVDPQYPRKEQSAYGLRLISGLFTSFLDLAGRGIEIETITARSHTPEGIRLMRKLGLTQIKSPVPAPGRHLFVVKVQESGLHVLERYSEILDEWKSNHPPTPQQTPLRSSHEHKSAPQSSTQPANTITLRDLANELGISRRTLLDWVRNPDNKLEHIAIENPRRAGEHNRYFTSDQAQAVKDFQKHGRKSN